jgi:hypothetical protein
MNRLKKALEDSASCSSKCTVRTVTRLIAIPDKVLRESGIFSIQDAQAQAKQAEIFNGSRPAERTQNFSARSFS